MVTFGRPHETKEKLGVVIRLTRLDEIINHMRILIERLRKPSGPTPSSLFVELHTVVTSRRVRRGPMHEISCFY